jgi:predicted transcriptional regulator
MPKPITPRPTDAELAILRILWDRGPSTVRQVHDVLSRERPTAYTTALKLMQIMTEKGLVRRDETERTHIYHARLTEEQTQRQLVRDLLERAFGGSASKLVMQALAAKRATAEELGEIRKLIDGRDSAAPTARSIRGGVGDSGTPAARSVRGEVAELQEGRDERD